MLHRLAAEWSFRSQPLDDEAVIGCLAEQLVHGGLVAVQDGDDLVPWTGTLHTDALPLADLLDAGADSNPRAPRSPRAATITWIEIVVHADDGWSLAGTEVRVDTPDGERSSHVLDETGVVRVDDIPRARTCTLELLRPMRRTRPSAIRPTPATFDAAVAFEQGGRVRLVTGCRHTIEVQRKVVEQPVVASAATFFAEGSAFPAAGIASFLRYAREIADREPDRVFGLFGHADPEGSVAANKRLTDRRARAVLALLTGDVDELDAVAIEDAWSPDCDQAMLRATPSAHCWADLAPAMWLCRTKSRPGTLSTASAFRRSRSHRCSMSI